MKALREVILATDLSSIAAKREIEFAKKICHSQEQRLTLLHVIPDGLNNPPIDKEVREREFEEHLEKLELAQDEFSCHCDICIVNGEVGESITNFVNESEAELLIVGHKEHGLYERFFFHAGKHEQRFLKDIQCAVLFC
jgi:nucleotide-binding universal stress UspA family protein